MKKVMVTIVAVLILFAFSMINAGDNWFDMENCAMCKPMASAEGLMDNMKWEQHKISNGVLSTCSVNPKYMDAYKKADAEMQATGEKLMTGEQMEMCGSCMTLGELFPKGLKHEKVETADGGIVIFSSDDAEIVKALHTWADKNAEEMAKMMKMMEKADPHAGHNH